MTPRSRPPARSKHPARLTWTTARLALAILLTLTAFGSPATEVEVTYLKGLTAFQREQYDEAERLWKAVIAEQRTYEHGERAAAEVLYELAGLYVTVGKLEQAERTFGEAIAGFAQGPFPDRQGLAESNHSLGLLYYEQRRLEESRAQLERSMEHWRTTQQTGLNPYAAPTLVLLARVYKESGQISKAEPLLLEADSIRGAEAYVSTAAGVFTALDELGAFYRRMGQFDKAEATLMRSLQLYRFELGAQDPAIAETHGQLAELYAVQGRLAEAESVLKRAMTIREATQGRSHPAFARTLLGATRVMVQQARFPVAKRLAGRALAIFAKGPPSNSPEVVSALHLLAAVEQQAGRSDDAAKLYEEALSSWQEEYDPLAAVSVVLDDFGKLRAQQGRLDDAETLLERSLEVREQRLGVDHYLIANTLGELADVHSRNGNQKAALDTARRATRIQRLRLDRTSGSRDIAAAQTLEDLQRHLSIHLRVLSGESEGSPAKAAPLAAEGFEVAQIGSASRAADAVSKMGARFAAESGPLADLAREGQDLDRKRRTLDSQLLRVALLPEHRRDFDHHDRLRMARIKLGTRLDQVDKYLARDYPDYAELLRPRLLSVQDTQSLLRSDEALLKYFVAAERAYLWVVRKDRAQQFLIPRTRAELAEDVTRVRQGLDLNGATRADQIPDYDLQAAYALYQQILEPAVSMLDGVRSLIVVPDGALQSLPFHALPTAPPPAAAGDRYDRYRATPWLARQYAVTILPGVPSLRVLRELPRPAPASKPFVGFGDPLLAGAQEVATRAMLPRLFAPGPVADISALRELPPLPETADELRTLARLTGAGSSDVFLGQQATETVVRNTPLGDYRIVAFATHALVAGDVRDFKGVTEPALVLTPPAISSAEDDGLLTASEIALLQLNADWVILSACDTAAPDGTPGAEGLSGLARAFFYAGSRALLVSYWPVVSESAQALTTRMFEVAVSQPGAGKSEALRQSMLALIDDKARPYQSHPLFWAPFTVVGEGGAP